MRATLRMPVSEGDDLNHTDMRADDWVGHWLPRHWRPYVRLARLDRPIGTWLLLLPAWWALAMAGDRDVGDYLLFSAGAVVMRGAGCTINDMWDREVDAKVARTRTRPLASGELSLRRAFLFLLVLLLLGLLVLVQFPPLTVLLGFASAPLIVVYPLMKHLTWWPQAFLGITFNWGVLMGAATATGALPAWTWPLYAAGLLWTLAYDTIYAHQDKEDDALVGVRSSARRLGAASRPWVAGFFAVSLLLVGLAGLAARMDVFFLFLLILPSSQAVWQVYGWNPDDPADCLRRFRTNRNFGLIVFGVIAAGAFFR